MRRRDFIAGIGSAAAWPAVARAQQSKMPVVGFLHTQSLEAMRDSLQRSARPGGILMARFKSQGYQ
jgi:hypothetical protein